VGQGADDRERTADWAGWPLEVAQAALTAAGRRVAVRATAWRGRAPGGPVDDAGAFRADGIWRVLAVRPRGDRDVELVVARFGRGVGSFAAEAGGAGGSG
jgi:hypothetical protein